MLEANFRNVKVKGKKLRNLGLATGIIKRLNGDIVPISMQINKLDKYFLNTNNSRSLSIVLDGETINTWVERTQKDVVFHNTINIDLKEVE